MARVFDARDPSIDLPSISAAALVVTYIGLAVTLAWRGEINLLSFAGGAATLTTGGVVVMFGVGKARQVDPAFRREETHDPDSKPDGH